MKFEGVICGRSAVLVAGDFAIVHDYEEIMLLAPVFRRFKFG
jgi:hypothetical protein